MGNILILVLSAVLCRGIIQVDKVIPFFLYFLERHAFLHVAFILSVWYNIGVA